MNGERWVPEELSVPTEIGVIARWGQQCKRCGRFWTSGSRIYRSWDETSPHWLCALCAVRERYQRTDLGELDPLSCVALTSAHEWVIAFESIESERVIDPAEDASPSDPDGLPKSDLTVEDLAPGELVRRVFGGRTGIVTKVDADDDKVWIKQVSNRDRGYILEERLCRAEWLEKTTEDQAWIDAPKLGDLVSFIDYGGYRRRGSAIEVDGIFLHLRYLLDSGDVRDVWIDRFERRLPRELRP